MKIEQIQQTLAEAFDVTDIPQMSKESIARQLLCDPKFYIENLLKVQNKEGQIVDFHFNRAQQKFYEEYKRQMQRQIPVRIIVLKARQLGFSTLVSSLFFQRCATVSDIRAMIVAHKAEASKNIFSKHKVFLEQLENEFRPMVKNSNAREVLFENPSLSPMERAMHPGMNSRIRIETAVSKTTGRSDTLQLLHISELAFWPYPEETYSSLMQAVPNTKNSCVIIESTANGVGNFFHRQWQEAERGESAFVPLFFPWFDEPEYRMPADGITLTEEEKEIKDQYGLDDEQIAWRRWCIRANCGGDVVKFRQEYPSTPNEAFVATGRPVFDTGCLECARKEAAKPKYEGRVYEINGRVEFQSGYNGYLKIWEMPQDGHSYVMGVDTSEGLAKGDYAVRSVFDRNTRSRVAEWHCHMDADLLGYEAANLGRCYKLAWIIPEANNTGIATIKALRRAQYPKIYRRRSTADKTADLAQDRYGFYTSSSTKATLIYDFAAYIREEWRGLKSKGLLDECLSYVYDDQGRTNAQQGCYDDRVIAAALAVYGLKEQPNYELKILNENFSDLYGANGITGY